MLQLPDDLLEICLARLTPRDIIACASTCKRINSIVTTSIVIQLKLHRCLYHGALPHDLPVKSNTTQSAHDQLVSLLREQQAFQDFRPVRSEYELGEGRTILCIHDDYMAVGLNDRAIDVEGQQPDSDGKYFLFELRPLQTSPESTQEARKIVFRVSFRPEYRTLLVDLGRNLIIVNDNSPVDVLHIRLHIFKAFHTDDQLEYQGAGIMDLSHHFQDESSSNWTRMTLGPEDTITISRGNHVKTFSWKDGSLVKSLKLPGNAEPWFDWTWLGCDLLVVLATLQIPRPEHESADDGLPFDYLQCLLVYQGKDLPLISSELPNPPTLALSLPGRQSDFPTHLQARLSSSIDFRKISGCEMLQARGMESETLYLHMNFGVNYDERQMRYEKRYNSFMVFPPGKFRELVDTHITIRSRMLDVSTFPDANEIIMIHPRYWCKYSFWTLDPVSPGQPGCPSFGSNLITYVESMNGYYDWESHEEVVSGDVGINLWNFACGITRSHPPLGYGLGGLGVSLKLLKRIECSKVAGDDTTFRSSIRTVVPSTDEALGATRSFGSYKFWSDRNVDAIHYHAGKIMVQYQVSMPLSTLRAKDYFTQWI
ncbi:hypothetical protein I204_02969 [Kwoniella mangroviensis CBS 8886]|nr:hypothetical protein I204_02969 [Kwoniella mangroviensis CBS 8886]